MQSASPPASAGPIERRPLDRLQSKLALEQGAPVATDATPFRVHLILQTWRDSPTQRFKPGLVQAVDTADRGIHDRCDFRERQAGPKMQRNNFTLFLGQSLQPLGHSG